MSRRRRAFAGQNVFKEASDEIWFAPFRDCDLGFFDYETYRLEPADNPFEAKVLAMSPDGASIVAGYFRRQLPPELEFAMHGG